MRGDHFRFIEKITLVATAAFVVACGGSPAPGDAGADQGVDTGTPDAVVVDVHGDVAQDARDVAGADASDVVSGDADAVELPDAAGDADAAEAYDAVDASDADAADVGDIHRDVDDLDGAADDGLEPCEDDGLECTVETRGDDGECVSTLLPDWCLIDEVCRPTGSVNPENPCLECRSDLLDSDWTVMDQKACDDGLMCTLNDVCGMDATCAGTAVVCLDDGNSCTDELCSPETGLCVTTTRSNGQSCADDGKQCTYDRCQAGVCVHAVKNGAVCDDGDKCTTGDACDASAICKGNPKSCPEDGNVCTENGCDPETGNCRNVLIDDNRPCEDYNWCTLNDGCRNGVCTGDPQDCSDGDPCTLDGCVDGPMGYCTNDPIFGSCEDGNLCTRGETCNPEGICEGGTEIVCDDFNTCTDDSCDPDVGCVFTSNYGYCSDGNPCTEGDSCDEDGNCVGIPKDCNDSNQCTRDYCFLGNCHHDNEMNGIDCDDGNVCTIGGTCDSGNCKPAGNVTCDDGNPCSVDLCDPLGGCYTEPFVCNDNNACTNDTCDPASGCVYTANTNLCDDGDACTEADRCSGGTCTGSPLDCSDGEPCTLDVCSNGVCSHPANTGFCDDENACTVGEKCYGPVCTGGATLDCYDGSDCTTDSCNPATGCVNTPITGGCDDGTVCTLSDRCSAGLCVGDALDCNDGNFCTNDLCHPLDGCYHENNALLCDDGNPCTDVDQCGGGTCQGNIVFRTPLMKTATYVIGTDGNTGNGLDVDGDPATCLPTNKCGNGIDNAFANMALMVKDQFNPDLVDRTASGDLAMFLEPEEPGPVGSPFEMKMFFGHKTAPTSCNAATGGCNYLAFEADTIGSCTVRYAFDKATTSSSHISAGGKKYASIVYFMIGSCPMPVALKWARVEADVAISGNSVVSGSGVLGGVINKLDFKYAIQAVSDSCFASSPYTKSQIILNVDQNLPMDADTDGNGTAESSSVGIKFSIVQGNVIGRDD